MNTPYQLLGGEAGVRALANAFYDAMDRLPEAAEIRAMHGANLDEIKEKLFEFLSGWMGGPPLYFQRKGTICLTSPHKPFAINAAHRDQWLRCMDEALEAVGASAEVKAMLKEPMFQLADIVRNVGDGERPQGRG
ncbi:MAG: group II truncated hemoglobin [Porticoccaceae bacterium]|jgi:hemoglobin|nr:group II truncated hemoglobin [Porticoccaceae bacterium]MEA3299243.1 group II truncated hemoglobin [Pseudomonadota bacterium]HLS97596.1 group II truncated hemoglobin [Porticoccaceae bacterium]